MKYAPIFVFILFLTVACGSQQEANTNSEGTSASTKEIEAQASEITDPIPSGDYSFPTPLDYLSHTPSALKSDLREEQCSKAYLIGWSRDSKFAYAEYDDISIPVLIVKVQDLKTDEAIFEAGYELPEEDLTEDDSEIPSAQDIWNAEIKDISQNLRQAGIIPISQQIKLQSFPAALTLSDGSQANFNTIIDRKKIAPTDETATDEVIKETVFLSKNGKATKEVYSNTEELMFSEGSAIAGYLLSPYEDRMVVCHIRRGYVFEGSGLSPNFIGCDLNRF